MRDNFYVVLPSNSSTSYFPDNTTTHFITRLPQQLRLQGEWGVSLTDIQIPMTFLHFPKDEKTTITRNSIYPITLGVLKDNEKDFLQTTKSAEKMQNRFEKDYIVPRGLYHSINDFIKTVNETALKDHLTFTLVRTLVD